MTGNSLIYRMLNDTRSRSLFFQFLLLFGIAFGLWWIVDNTITNLGAQNKSVGFGFLFQTAGFQINSTLGTWLFEYEAGASTYLDVYYIGIVNTFVVAFWYFCCDCSRLCAGNYAALSKLRAADFCDKLH